MIDANNFRRLCGRFATGVTIVTAIDAEGFPCGMTASSFASVSLEPPLIAVAIDHVAAIYPALRRAARFAVNILDARQEALSRRFAAGLPDRFEGIGWQRNEDGDVIIAGTLAHLGCEKQQEIPSGDHSIFVGLVTGGDAASHGRPLLHYRGGYGDLDAI